MQRFGEKMRALRKQRGMTIQKLARVLGYRTGSYITELEQGKKIPKMEFIAKVADVFGVPMETLMRDELDLEQQ